jgi:hypothetical protein
MCSTSSAASDLLRALPDLLMVGLVTVHFHVPRSMPCTIEYSMPRYSISVDYPSRAFYASGSAPVRTNVAAITVASNAAAMGGALSSTSNELFGAAAATLASIKAAIDLYNAGSDRSLPSLEFHITDHFWTGFHFWTDFPVPPRGWPLLNVKINATMLHDRPLLCAKHTTHE